MKGFRQVLKYYFAFPPSTEMPWTFDFVFSCKCWKWCRWFVKEKRSQPVVPSSLSKAFPPISSLASRRRADLPGAPAPSPTFVSYSLFFFFFLNHGLGCGPDHTQERSLWPSQTSVVPAVGASPSAGLALPGSACSRRCSGSALVEEVQP